MFNKEDKPKNENATFSVVSEATDHSSAETKYAVKDGNTVIGPNTAIEGSIRGEENIILEGHIKGKIVLEKHDFKVGSKGRFDGDIQAQNVNISGLVMGTVKTKSKVELTREADFIGDIRAKNFLMEEGAYFKGSIELDREPNRKELLMQKENSIEAQPSQKEPKRKSD